MTITRAEAADRLLEFAQGGRLIQNYWRRTEDGRELACLLAAIGPDLKTPYYCPAAVMPFWMANALMSLSDGVAADKITPLAIRFAEALRVRPVDKGLKRRWFIRAIEYAVVAAAPEVLPAPYYWAPVETACEHAIMAIRAADKDFLAGAAIAARKAAFRAEQAVDPTEAGGGHAAMRAAGAAWTAGCGAAGVWFGHGAKSSRRGEGPWAGWSVARSAARAAGPAAAADAYEALFVALIEEMTR